MLTLSRQLCSYVKQLIAVWNDDTVLKAEEAVIMKRLAIYLRVSTSKQDTANQLRELKAVAKVWLGDRQCL